MNTLEAPDRVLRRAAIFRGASEPDLEELCTHAERFGLERGEYAFCRGEQGTPHLYVIVSGKIKLVSADAQRERVVALLGAPEEFGELAIFDPGPHTLSAVAVLPSMLLRIPGEVVWVWARPMNSLRLLRLIARRQRRTDSLLADVVEVDAYGRLARQLLQLADRFGSTVDGRIRVQHDLSQDELAQLTGISRETVNRALSEFAERGWACVEPGSVTICQPEPFAQRAHWRR